ncbi:hypothetical protein N7523_003576 [Penicillium sp. IBT 18751x]|nr:hypothetical protein N7523_003576 [Penicillium sp. IBT 18751x]
MRNSEESSTTQPAPLFFREVREPVLPVRAWCDIHTCTWHQKHRGTRLADTPWESRCGDLQYAAYWGLLFPSGLGGLGIIQFRSFWWG